MQRRVIAWPPEHEAPAPHDRPFDFAYQVTYETHEVLMPGESITTTCTYSEPKCAGQATSQEMCYNFTYAYPKHALVDEGGAGSAAHGEGTCFGQGALDI